ncbi:MAG: tetratricopeptide repeat protein [Flavobacteriales bacterium]|nr:tetratricopeptide repeat protein [Flavobacteriales bacterium]
MDAWLGKAMVYDFMGKEEEALAHIRKAVDLEPVSQDVAMVSGCMHMKAGLLEQAIDVFEALVQEDSNCIDGWINLSDCHVARGHHEQALERVENGLNENPDHPTLLYRKVAYMHLLNKKKEALLLLRHLAEQEPDGLTELLTYYPDFLQEEEVLQIVHSTGN